MAHFKCLRCRSRVWRDAPEATPVDALCPGCGDPLDAVADLNELIGLRSLQARPHATRPSSDRSARISQQIRETIARHDAERRRGIDSES